MRDRASRPRLCAWIESPGRPCSSNAAGWEPIPDMAVDRVDEATIEDHAVKRALGALPAREDSQVLEVQCPNPLLTLSSRRGRIGDRQRHSRNWTLGRRVAQKLSVGEQHPRGQVVGGFVPLGRAFALGIAHDLVEPVEELESVGAEQATEGAKVGRSGSHDAATEGTARTGDGAAARAR